MKWEKKRVKDVCELAYGKTLTAKSRIPGDFPVYSSAGEIGTHNTYVIEGPGIIIGRKGSAGTVYYEKRNFFPIDTSFYVIPKENYDLRFLYYKLLTLGLDSLNSDAAVPGLNRNIAYEQESYFPPLPTQRRIASILSAYDDLIENNLQRIKLLEEKAFAKYRMIAQTEQMEDKTIDELADVVMGQSPPSSTYTDRSEGNLPFHQGVKDFSNYFVEHVTYCTSPKRIANAGDILFSVRAPVGRINYTYDKICIGRGLCAFKSKKGYQNYFYYQLKNFFFEEDIVGTGAIFNSVTKKELVNIKLPTPSDKIQNDFENIATPIYNQILALTKQNKLLSEARDILLPRLMNQQIEV